MNFSCVYLKEWLVDQEKKPDPKMKLFCNVVKEKIEKVQRQLEILKESPDKEKMVTNGYLRKAAELHQSIAKKKTMVWFTPEEEQEYRLLSWLHPVLVKTLQKNDGMSELPEDNKGKKGASSSPKPLSQLMDHWLEQELPERQEMEQERWRQERQEMEQELPERQEMEQERWRQERQEMEQERWRQERWRQERQLEPERWRQERQLMNHWLEQERLLELLEELLEEQESTNPNPLAATPNTQSPNGAGENPTQTEQSRVPIKQSALNEQANPDQHFPSRITPPTAQNSQDPQPPTKQ